MNDAQFMGLMIGAIITLLGGASIIVAIIIKPVINLNKTITKLDSTIAGLQKEEIVLQTRVSKHGDQIDEVRLKVREHDTVLKQHGEDIDTLKRRA